MRLTSGKTPVSRCQQTYTEINGFILPTEPRQVTGSSPGGKVT